MSLDLVPVRLDLSQNFSLTGFAITETGQEIIPFLVAMPQLSKLDEVVDTSPEKECMPSRTTGLAYKLRKPKAHLLRI